MQNCTGIINWEIIDMDNNISKWLLLYHDLIMEEIDTTLLPSCKDYWNVKSIVNKKLKLIEEIRNEK